MMIARVSAALLAAGVLAAGLPPTASAQGRKPVACAKIMDMCMKRAGDGHAGICEDMYSQAKNTGYWPATEEPDGTKHPAINCLRD